MLFGTYNPIILTSRTNDRRERASRELLAHVARTPVRPDILAAVDDIALNLRDLSDRLDVPRTTVRHNLKRLLKEGLVEETIGNEYRTTELGGAVLLGMDGFERRFETALKLSPLLECLPRDEIGVDVYSLTDATVTTTSQADPVAPLRRLEELVEQASRLDGYFPVYPLLGDIDDVVCRRDGFEATLFLTPGVADKQLSADGAPETPAGGTAVELRVVDNGPQYGLAVTDRRALLLGLDETDKPHVLLETTSASCHDWVGRRLDRIRSNTAVDAAEAAE